MKPVEFEIAALSDPGRKRGGAPNEDSLLLQPPLIAVADGMGGHAGGAIASRTVVESMGAYFTKSSAGADGMLLLDGCLQAALQALREHAASSPSLAAMGSTVVMAVLGRGQAYIANVGDSRAYLLHGREMTQVSYDHSVVAEQVRLGTVTPLQARTHPKRNRLTQSLSPRRGEVKPHICQVTMARDDSLILCSDGLWGVVPEVIIQAVVNDLPPSEAVRKLTDLALASGGPDNITVIIARRKDAHPIPLFSGADETGG